MGFEDEYGELDALPHEGDVAGYQDALDEEGVEALAREAGRAAAYQGLQEEFEPFPASRVISGYQPGLNVEKTYRRAREKVLRVDPEPDVVVVDRYLRDMRERLPAALRDHDKNFGQGVKWKMRPVRARVEARGLTVAAAAIADTLEPQEVRDMSREARAVVAAGAMELPESLQAEAACVWDTFR